MSLILSCRYKKTQLFGVSKDRVRREYANIQEELHWWRLLPQHTGVEFSGTAIDMFWSQKDFGRGGLIPHIPYKLLKESITKVMEETRGTSKDNNLDPDAYIEEVVFLLEGLIDSVYHDMVLLEQDMRKIPRENTAFRAWEVESCSGKLKEYLRERAAAAKLLGKGLEGKSEPEQKATPSPINIQSSNVVLGGIHQTGNLQVGNHSQIQESKLNEEKKSRGVKKLLKIVAAIVGFLAALLTCIYLTWWLWTKFSA